MMMNSSALAAYAQYTLAESFIPELPDRYRGKVRENYDLRDGTRILIATDRISAFDRILAAIPLKGMVLTQTARFWFEATKHVCRNHVIEYPDPNVLVCKRLSMMPVEIVVRDYLAGTTATSILQMYKKGSREMYGHCLPEGLRDNQKLPETIITPTTKAEQGDHDAPLSGEEILARKLLTEKQWREVSENALALFACGRELAAKRGLILVDTKYEFGFDENGAIVLADEVHTPDSSRYWLLASYSARFAAGELPDTLDKDFIRRWLAARCDPYKDQFPEIPPEVILEAAARYVNLYEQLTGQELELPEATVPPLTRIRANLKKYFSSRDRARTDICICGMKALIGRGHHGPHRSTGLSSGTRNARFNDFIKLRCEKLARRGDPDREAPGAGNSTVHFGR